MSTARLDILGIGNAIVDVLISAEDREIAGMGLQKGAMTLIDADQALRLHPMMASGVQSSGGSAANTCAVAAMLGAKAAFLGKVADDPLGAAFRHDIEAAGVRFPSLPLAEAAPTARCLIMVTPDAQRTMSTYLGASAAFSERDLDFDLIADAAVLYLEGYLFDPVPAQRAFRAAAAAARNARKKVALSLSDPFCVGRHRASFRALVQAETDVLFANEAEICALYQTKELQAALEIVRTEVEIAVITRGAAGSLVLADGSFAEIAAESALVIDTTGAGDAFAAGFLAGYTRGQDAPAAAVLGAKAAACVIEQYGARPAEAVRRLRGMAARGAR